MKSMISITICGEDHLQPKKIHVQHLETANTGILTHIVQLPFTDNLFTSNNKFKINGPEASNQENLPQMQQVMPVMHGQDLLYKWHLRQTRTKITICYIGLLRRLSESIQPDVFWGNDQGLQGVFLWACCPTEPHGHRAAWTPSCCGSAQTKVWCT